LVSKSEIAVFKLGELAAAEEADLVELGEVLFRLADVAHHQ